MAVRFGSLAPLLLIVAVLFLVAPSYVAGLNVTFVIQKKVAYGRGLRIAGNTTNLGDWATASAAQMEVNTTTEQDWSVTVVISLDEGVRVEFKPLITNYGTGDNATWYPCDNFVFEVPNASALVVPMKWTSSASLDHIKQVVN